MNSNRRKTEGKKKVTRRVRRLLNRTEFIKYDTMRAAKRGWGIGQV